MLRRFLRCKIWRHICKHFQWLGKQLCFTTMECVHFPLVCTEPTDTSSTFKRSPRTFGSLRRTLKPSQKHSVTRTTAVQEVCLIQDSLTHITYPWITAPLWVNTVSPLHMAPWDISLSFQRHDNRVTGGLSAAWWMALSLRDRRLGPSAKVIWFRSGVLAHVHVDGKKPMAQNSQKAEFGSVGGAISFFSPQKRLLILDISSDVCSHSCVWLDFDNFSELTVLSWKHLWNEKQTKY